MSQTSEPNKAVSLAQYGAAIARRREALGIADADIPRNAGNRRTPSKRALLAAIEKAGGRW